MLRFTCCKSITGTNQFYALYIELMAGPVSEFRELFVGICVSMWQRQQTRLRGQEKGWLEANEF